MRKNSYYFESLNALNPLPLLENGHLTIGLTSLLYPHQIGCAKDTYSIHVLLNSAM